MRYQLSKMGKLEQRIKTFNYHQFKYIVTPEKITIPSDGTTTQFQIKSNTDWSIS